CRKWFCHFREGNFDLEDENLSGRPSRVDKKIEVVLRLELWAPHELEKLNRLDRNSNLRIFTL
ncbi:hypothetical protein WH47_01213, partial [Habropoda laboriosa]